MSALRLIDSPILCTAAVREFESDCAGHALSNEEFQTIIQTAETFRRGLNLPAGYVPAASFWLMDEDTCVGSISVRYALSAALRRFGGHIGYVVGPKHRGRGYGTQMLRLALPEAAKLGIAQALLTCADSNTASWRVMEKNGGLHVDTINIEMDGQARPTRRYLISTGLADGTLYTSGAPWYHGSNSELTFLAAGSTITQNRGLAEAFLHKPTWLSRDDDGSIDHNGTQPGILYEVCGHVLPADNIYMHPRTSMQPGLEWVTTEAMPLRKIGPV